ncbi:hypothetical protein AB2S62_18510 [Vibrio sp. NTOU-M3]|uniref:hypothetical protein n=1 Tax=Vibrio sp. NTOU-M3 TaxID=3234954 RepID=UPI00349F6C4F
MRADQMYYAAFSAALMAGAEPDVAQRLAYQLAQITHAPPDSLPIRTTKPEQAIANTETETQKVTPSNVSRCPINPLSHVDWLNGGMLNTRGRRLGYFSARSPQAASHSAQLKTIRHRVQKANSRLEVEEDKLNHAILLALTNTDGTALSKFALALFSYIQHKALLSTQEIHSLYWLMMHAIRCYLFGTTFQWQKSFATSTRERQQKKPMFVTVESLCDLMRTDATEPELYKSLSEHLSYFPPVQQLQCLALGVAFRAELMDEYDLANSAHHTALRFPDLEQARSWLRT